MFTDWSDRPESWKRSGNSAKPEVEKIAGRPPGNGITCHPGGRTCGDVWLIHTERCREVGAQRVAANGPPCHTGSATTAGVYGEYAERSAVSHREPDGLETIAAYECLATCPAGHETVASSGAGPPTCSCGLPTAWSCCIAALDQRVGLRKSGARAAGIRKGMGYHGAEGDGGPAIEGNEGPVSRYFHQDIPRLEEEPGWIYDPKCPSAERHAGGRNAHPCVKPGSVRPEGLLRRLWRLILPPTEIGVDPFAGCGSGPAAAAAEELYVVGIEMDHVHVEYAHEHIPALLALARMQERGVKPSAVKAKRARAQTDLTFGDGDDTHRD